MIGTVHPGEIVVPVRVRGLQGATARFTTVLDTGFNDWLTLSAAAIAELALPFREEGRYLLANGSETVARLFTAELDWLGAWRRILVVEMEGGPLLGMAMLRGYYLGVEFVEGGRVEVEPLASNGRRP